MQQDFGTISMTCSKQVGLCAVLTCVQGLSTAGTCGWQDAAAKLHGSSQCACDEYNEHSRSCVRSKNTLEALTGLSFSSSVCKSTRGANRLLGSVPSRLDPARVTRSFHDSERARLCDAAHKIV